MALIFVDCEAPFGKGAPSVADMTEFGAVEFETKQTFHGKDCSKKTFAKFKTWLKEVSRDRPVFVSDNCMAHSTRVLLAEDCPELKTFKARHRTAQIGEIVKKQIPVLVWSYNFFINKIEKKEVVDWIFNPAFKRSRNIEGKFKSTFYSSSTWIKIITELNNQGARYTEDHKIWTTQGWKAAKDLKRNDIVWQIDISPNYDQKQLLLGSLMGDASLGRKEKRGKTWNVSHANKEYTKFKKEILGDLVVSEIKMIDNNRGYNKDKTNCFLWGFHTKTLRMLDNKDMFYMLEQINWRGIAVWYMDDGSLSTHKRKKNDSFTVTIHTEGLSYEANKELAYILSLKTNLSWKIRANRDKFYITLSTKDSIKFLEKITPYIDVSMKYKVPNKLYNVISKANWNKNILMNVYETKINNVLKVKSKTKRNDRDGNYCLTVKDNHNFFTTTGLVKNCAYDWQWINYYFWKYFNMNPFGHSGRRIGDFYAGLMGNFYKTQSWKKFRKTKHDHNPVHDALGNAEAFEEILKIQRLKK